MFDSRIRWCAHPPNQTGATQGPQCPPTWVPLTRCKSQPRGAGKGVMIVVPALTHGQQRDESHVPTLYGRTANLANDRAMVVSEIADQPVSEHRGGNSGAHAPPDKAPTADEVEEQGRRHLLCHPRFFQYAIEVILENPSFNADFGRSGQDELAMQLPPGIHPW